MVDQPRDLLVAVPAATTIGEYLFNVFHHASCLVACILTGHTNKTLSWWLGKAKEGKLGPWWRVGLSPLWWLVDLGFSVFLGERDHCRLSFILAPQGFSN